MGQDDKIKALEAAITKIEKDFGKGAIMKLLSEPGCGTGTWRCSKRKDRGDLRTGVQW